MHNGIGFSRKGKALLQKDVRSRTSGPATADLLTKATSCAARTAVADIVEGQSLEVGEQITVEVENGKLVGRRGFTEVARFNSPPSNLFQAVEASCGIAKGTVEQIHHLAGVAEISLC
jgi:hypothetical protein